MHLSTLLALTYPLLASAHFNLNYPPARGFDEDKLGEFPCGSQNTVSDKRTEWGLAGGPIDLTMGHPTASVQVLLGLGNDPGSGFNITLLPTIQEEGLGKFCMPDIQVPASLGIKDGDNATIQVVTNGDPNGGLYNCADITFKTSPAAPPSCTNNTGVTTKAYTGTSKNANGSDSSAPSSTASGTAATPSATKHSAGQRLASACSTAFVMGIAGIVFAGAL